ncbi:MAG: GNAT family N-acetyltransferase [Lachnospiraceae bacterium]|nr:GNAT family N-acetyltransferase [Lachnospiraceae bacterium]
MSESANKNRILKLDCLLVDNSTRFEVKRLNEADADKILRLCKGNPLFYEYHPPFATRESILEDMSALPPHKTYRDKYYVGFYEGDLLVAVLDLILNYPQEGTAYIGFFMVDASCQRQGLGSGIVQGIAGSLKKIGFVKIRLAIDEGNPQSEAFWTKNGFVKTGERHPNDFSAYLPMEKEL